MNFLSLCCLFFGGAVTLYGSSTFDGFHLKKIHAGVLKDCIGWYSNYRTNMKGLPTFRNSNCTVKASKPQKYTPVSAFGLDGSSDDPDSELFFPLTEISGKCIEIVYDSAGNGRVWIQKPEESKLVPLPPKDVGKLSVFSSMTNHADSVEVFELRGWQERKLYVEPNFKSKNSIIKKNPTGSGGYWFGEQKGNWLQIVTGGKAICEGGSSTPQKKLGWIPVKDEDGLLTLWPVHDSCD